VRSDVQPREEAILSGNYNDPILSQREALAVELAERMAGDPHSVTDSFWQELKGVFSDDELVELAFASSIFNWGNKFNITMRLDTDGVNYEKDMAYKDSDTYWRKRPVNA
jgi:alkylhydroperoxidase family enzyme